MTEEDLFADLPDDPELAFLKIESFFRETCQDQINRTHEGDHSLYYVEYISKVLAAIRELELTAAFETEVPLIQNVSFHTYANFSKDVDHYRTALQIRHSRRNKGLSVRFDLATKEKIRHHITQVRGIVETLEVEQDKKEILLRKLNLFAIEVDKDRTSFAAFGDLVIQAAEVFGEAAEKAEPARKWLETIGRVIWGAKKEEDAAKQLPAPTERKRIEAPKKEGAPKADKLDDEIPF